MQDGGETKSSLGRHGGRSGGSEEFASWCSEQAEVSEAKTESWMGQVTVAEEDRPGERKGLKIGEEENQEWAEERGQMDEEAMAADQE